MPHSGSTPGFSPVSAAFGTQTKTPELPPDSRCRHSIISSKFTKMCCVRSTPIGLPVECERVVGPGPGVAIAVDPGEVRSAQSAPAGLGAIDEGARPLGLLRGQRRDGQRPAPERDEHPDPQSRPRRSIAASAVHDADLLGARFRG